MTDVDQAFEKTRAGSHDGFAAWVRLCEAPLRRSLRSFARVVDVEAIVQEGLLRMWVLAPRLELAGENASLRYAHRLLRNLALSEARRLQRVTPVELAELERLPAAVVEPDPPASGRLREAVRDCFERLPKKPRLALLARLGGKGALLDRSIRSGLRRTGSSRNPGPPPQPVAPDKELAARLDMKLNTFLQNIVRARRFLADCLAGHGINVEDFL